MSIKSKVLLTELHTFFCLKTTSKAVRRKSVNSVVLIDGEKGVWLKIENIINSRYFDLIDIFFQKRKSLLYGTDL